MSGDRVYVIDSRGGLSSATVLSCSMAICSTDFRMRWSVTVWVPDTREVQEITVEEYSEVIKGYSLDLEI
jgi:hypothetical protein